jgi:hypothetical protein
MLDVYVRQVYVGIPQDFLLDGPLQLSLQYKFENYFYNLLQDPHVQHTLCVACFKGRNVAKSTILEIFEISIIWDIFQKINLTMKLHQRPQPDN